MKRALIIFSFLLLNTVCVHPKAFCLAAPSWELDDLDGRTRRLEEWRGKWVLLKLGTTHCPNCSVELEEMAKVKDQLQGLGVEILDIYLRENKRSVTKYLEKTGVDLQRTILYDWRGRLVTDYGVSIIPHLVLVDPGGAITWQGEFTPGEELLKLLESQIRTGDAKAR